METIITEKKVEEIPLREELREIRKNQEKILGALEGSYTSTDPEYITAIEFMNRLNIGRWKFNQLRVENKIEVLQRGKKLYVKADQVRKYFESENI